MKILLKILVLVIAILIGVFFIQKDFNIASYFVGFFVGLCNALIDFCIDD